MLTDRRDLQVRLGGSHYRHGYRPIGVADGAIVGADCAAIGICTAKVTIDYVFGPSLRLPAPSWPGHPHCLDDHADRAAVRDLVNDDGNTFTMHRHSQKGSDASAQPGAVVLEEARGGVSRTDMDVTEHHSVDGALIAMEMDVQGSTARAHVTWPSPWMGLLNGSSLTACLIKEDRDRLSRGYEVPSRCRGTPASLVSTSQYVGNQ